MLLEASLSLFQILWCLFDEWEGEPELVGTEVVLVPELLLEIFSVDVADELAFLLQVDATLWLFSGEEGGVFVDACHGGLRGEEVEDWFEHVVHVEVTLVKVSVELEGLEADHGVLVGHCLELVFVDDALFV